MIAARQSLPGCEPRSTRKVFDLISISKTTSQGKPVLGKSNGDKELLLSVLRAASARAKLIANTIDTVGVALRQKSITVDNAMQWLHDEDILPLLQFGPPSQQYKTGGAS